MTDNSAVQISINVVDSNSGQVLNNVVKNLDNLGNAGAGSGKKLKQGLEEAGLAGTAAGSKIGDGMKAASGHTLSSLDNVRLLRDDLGIRIPRAMEKVISQSKLAMGAIGALGGGLIALGSVEVLARLGTQIYDVYKKFIDTGSQVDEFNKKLGETAEKKFFDVAQIEDVNAHLIETNKQIDALDKKRRDAPGIFSQAFSGFGLAQGVNPKELERFTADDAAKRNKAQEGNNDDRRRKIEEDHKARVQEIEDNKLRAASLKGYAAAQAEANAKIAQAQETRRFNRARGELELNIQNYGSQIIDPSDPRYKRLAPDSGSAQEGRDVGSANAGLQAKDAELARTNRQETLKLESEARTARMRGEAQYAAQRDEQIRVLGQKLRETELAPIDYARQVAAVQEKYSQERLRRLDTERAETERLKIEANSGGLTGLARIDAERNTKIAGIEKEAPTFSDPNTKNEREGAARQQANSQAVQEQQQFSDRLAQIDASRADRFESENQRIQSAADRTVREIMKAWTEMYGQLGPLDARRVQSYAAVQAEIVKIEQDTVKQQQESRQRLEDDTRKVEEDGARSGMTRQHEKTQQILDEYADRYRHLEELRIRDADNADLYRRQEIAAEEIKNGKLVEQQRELRDKLAGSIRGYFTHPLDELKKQGEEAAAKIAAGFILKAAPKAAGIAGAGGKHGGLFSDWTDVGGVFSRKGQTNAPSHPDAGQHPSISAPSTTMNASNAIINVQNATFSGGPVRTGAPRTAGLSGGDSGGSSAGGFGGRAFGGSSSTSSADSIGLGGGDTSGGSGGGSAFGGALSSIPGLGGGGTSSAGDFAGGGDITGVASLGLDGSGGGAAGGDAIGGALSGIPGLGGGDGASGGGAAGDAASGLGGAASGAVGLFSAFEGGGGFGGALQGALGGAQLGMEIGGPIGAAIGAGAGAIMGFIGFGAKMKAEKYDKYTLQPQIREALRTYEAGATDYSSTYSALDKMGFDAKETMKQFGQGGISYYNDNVTKEIRDTQARLTREQKSGRSEFGFTAAQFHGGGRISDFGSFATSSNEGFIHALADETIMNKSASVRHPQLIDSLNNGASPSDIAAMYGAKQAPAASSGGIANLHFHSHDAKGAYNLFMDNKHHIRAALNDSYAENSGGADFA